MHHHIVPEFYVERLESIGITESYGQPFPKWSPADSLSFMKKMEISTAMMSISTPGVSFADAGFSAELARTSNEYMATVKEEHPGRFGGFISVPSPNTRRAVEEVAYGFDRLHLDGVCLFTHYDGKYLGDGSFEELFCELNRRKAVVFVHPTDPAQQYDPKLKMRNSLIEAPFETTRAIANLMFTGALNTYTDITYILSHGGGTIPFLAWRVALNEYLQEDKKPPVFKSIYDFLIKGGPVSGLKLLQAMFYDTALTTSPYALRALQEFVGSKRIVFGTDYPFGAKFAPMLAKDLMQFDGFAAEDQANIARRNSAEVFRL